MQQLSPSDRALGDLLVDRRVLTLPQLDEATALAEKWHAHLGDAMLSRNWVEPAAYYQGVAFHYGLPFVDLVQDAPDVSLLSARDTEIYTFTLTMPWRKRDGRMLIATAEPGPDTVLFARERWGANIEFIVASKFDITWAVQTAFTGALSHRAVYQLAERDPAMSAQQVVTTTQIAIVYALLSAFLLGLAVAPIGTLIALNVAMSLFYLGNFIFKGILVSVGGGRSADADDAIAIAARELTDEELPVYTVLVPMYREPEMLPFLADALRALDYPALGSKCTLSLLNLLAGNGAFAYLSMLAPIRRGWLDLIPFSLTVPGYWVLISIAAYRALWQLLRDPFYWEKTQHGQSRFVAGERRRALKLARRPA